MPIVPLNSTGPALGPSDPRPILHEWFHSTVFTTALASMQAQTLNLPPLTTIYTPQVQCVDRWMVGPGVQSVI
jgi:hypothetical protein